VGDDRRVLGVANLAGNHCAGEATARMPLRVSTLFFFVCTYGFLISNLLAAHITTYSLFFVALRDSWVFVFVILLVLRRDLPSVLILSALAFFGLFGFVPIVVEGVSLTNLLVYFYGLRELMVIGVIYFFLLVKAPLVSKRQIMFFVYLVAGLFLLQVALQLVGLDQVSEAIFNTTAYYAGKGIEINLGGGLFGQRPGAPFYSPALVATTLSSFALAWGSFFGRWLLVILACITLSKVVVYFVVMRVFRRAYVALTLAALCAIPLILYGTSYVKEEYPNTIYSFHAHSISERAAFATYVRDEDLSIYPDLLGSSSIAAHVLRGDDAHQAPESLLLARILDYNFWGVLLIVLIGLGYFTLDARCRFIYVALMGLQLLTGMSNHPVALMPLLAWLQLRGTSSTDLSGPLTINGAHLSRRDR
jgi:hypothetical protein